jgi:hypothetical protein
MPSLVVVFTSLEVAERRHLEQYAEGLSAGNTLGGAGLIGTYGHELSVYVCVCVCVCVCIPLDET